MAGEVVALHPQFREGACLPAGTLLVQLDARDYQLALAQREAAVRQAEARLALEEGQQQVARQEWQRYQSSGQPLPESAHLVLRQPQLEQARADLASARAALGQARLELERTAIRLPFDALILRQQVEQGAQLAAQGTVATLVDSGTFEVEVTVPLDALALLDLPRPGHLTGGAGARIERTDRPGGGSARQGQVIALLGELADGRMARLRVAVADPLTLRAATPPDWPLLLGDYVAVSLLGRLLPQVAVVPRALLRDGDQLWLLTPQQTLEIRPVEVLWRDQHQVYLRGVVAGEQLVETDLAAPVAGMALRPLVPEDDA
ncbi:MAG: HlyD family efflux transporter periplasmic adaptor subunit [Desulfuromonas thiophila]|nr:HlyD family efflux transporter periplasmic adaptor subunit [Desulfuromonas thiophila]